MSANKSSVRSACLEASWERIQNWQKDPRRTLPNSDQVTYNATSSKEKSIIKKFYSVDSDFFKEVARESPILVAAIFQLLCQRRHTHHLEKPFQNVAEFMLTVDDDLFDKVIKSQIFLDETSTHFPLVNILVYKCSHEESREVLQAIQVRSPDILTKCVKDELSPIVSLLYMLTDNNLRQYYTATRDALFPVNCISREKLLHHVDVQMNMKEESVDQLMNLFDKWFVDRTEEPQQSVVRSKQRVHVAHDSETEDEEEDEEEEEEETTIRTSALIMPEKPSVSSAALNVEQFAVKEPTVVFAPAYEPKHQSRLVKKDDEFKSTISDLTKLKNKVVQMTEKKIVDIKRDIAGLAQKKEECLAEVKRIEERIKERQDKIAGLNNEVSVALAF